MARQPKKRTIQRMVTIQRARTASVPDPTKRRTIIPAANGGQTRNAASNTIKPRRY